MHLFLMCYYLYIIIHDQLSLEIMIKLCLYFYLAGCDVIVPVGNKDIISCTASWPGWRLLSDLWQVDC